MGLNLRGFLFGFVLHAIAPSKTMQQEENVCYTEFLFNGKICSLFAEVHRNDLLHYYSCPQQSPDTLFENKITRCTAGMN